MIVFLAEEPSMVRFLRGLLPRLIPGWIEGQDFLLIRHHGKQDLEKSLPIKLRGWNTEASFLVLRDNDGADCRALKARLVSLCQGTGKANYLVRLVMQELESWYLGDLAAVAKAFDLPHLVKKTNVAKFRDPDILGNPAQELERLVVDFQKNDAAERLGPLIEPGRNTSLSFKIFCEGVLRLYSQEHNDEALA